MFTKKNESQLQLTQLQLIVSLIKEKFSLRSEYVTSKIDDPDKLTVMLLNGRTGADTPEVDSVNKRPIQFLKAHNGEVTKEEHEHHSYWSYSVITLDKEMLGQIIEGLNLLPTPDHEPKSRIMARC